MCFPDKTKPKTVLYGTILGLFIVKAGGETGIRTLGTIACTTVFETVPFDHSGISPWGGK